MTATGWAPRVSKGRRLCPRSMFILFQEYLYEVVDALDALAAETGKSVPQLALNWLLRKAYDLERDHRARNEQQPHDNPSATSFVLAPEQVAGLDQASQLELLYPYWQREFANRNPPPPAYRP